MHISLVLKYSMDQKSPVDNENFIEEIGKYVCLNNKFSKEYKDNIRN